jgi:pilus assembly protein CpaC
LKNHQANHRRGTGRRQVDLIGASIGGLALWLLGAAGAWAQTQGGDSPLKVVRPFQSVTNADAATPSQTPNDGVESPRTIKGPTTRPDGAAPPPPPRPQPDVPRVIPIEPLPGTGVGPAEAKPRILTLPRDTTGLAPGRPPGPAPKRSNDEIAHDVADVVELIKEPEAEIAVVVGDSKLIQTRRTLTRILVANPAVADVEMLNDQNEARLLNVYGKSFGTTSLTLWDETNRPVSFVVRVTIDAQELESRIAQAFPGSQVKVRQVGPQVILDGQVSDAKMMTDILQVVTATVRASGGLRMGTTGAGGSTTSGGAGGGAGSNGGGMGASGGAGAIGGTAMGGQQAGGMTIINRVVVPGPRQVMLHVKIAELNRQALRQLGISWLDTKGRSIMGSSAGQVGAVSAAGEALHSTTADPRGFLNPLTSTFQATGAASSGGELFGVFDAGHFSLFIHALRKNSLAKILAEPNLVALDGQPARFLVGGEFPFPVPQSSSLPGGTAVVTILFRRFGTILNFVPEILPNDVIRLDVEPVISQLNFSQSTTVNQGQVPSIVERSARTVVELREGQTLAIAGLLQLTTDASTSRIPGLGDLPLVGPWFSSNTITTVETETIILVTPELVAPLDRPEVTEAPGDRVYQPSDAEFYFLGRLEGKLGTEFRATKAEQDPLNLMKHFQSERDWVIGPHGYAD